MADLRSVFAGKGSHPLGHVLRRHLPRSPPDVGQRPGRRPRTTSIGEHMGCFHPPLLRASDYALLSASDRGRGGSSSASSHSSRRAEPPAPSRALTATAVVAGVWSANGPPPADP